MSITIQKMPDIWDDQKFWTTKETILGALASWAIQQSPYFYPCDLPTGLLEFYDKFEVLEDLFETSCEQLEKKVRETFKRCSTIIGWSKPEVGNIQVVHDFIDLDALAKNIAHSVTLEEKYRELHN